MFTAISRLTKKLDEVRNMSWFFSPKTEELFQPIQFSPKRGQAAPHVQSWWLIYYLKRHNYYYLDNLSLNYFLSWLCDSHHRDIILEKLSVCNGTNPPEVTCGWKPKLPRGWRENVNIKLNEATFHFSFIVDFFHLWKQNYFFANKYWFDQF